MKDTLEDFLQRTAAEAESTRPGRRKFLNNSGYSYTNDKYKDIDAEADIIKEYNKEVLNFVNFVNNCKLKVSKPKVQRTKGDWFRKSFNHNNRYVSPMVTLVHGPMKIVVQNPDHFVIDKTIGMPWLLYYYMKKITICDYYRKLAGGMTLLFKERVDPKWTELHAEVQEIWDNVENNLEKIVLEHLDANLSNERRIFRSKLVTLFSNTKKLVDASPEAILEIFNLGSAEIDSLRSFASRNKADIGMVEVEDVITAQNESRVKFVMES